MVTQKLRKVCTIQRDMTESVQTGRKLNFALTCTDCGCYVTASSAQAEKRRRIMKDRLQKVI